MSAERQSREAQVAGVGPRDKPNKMPLSRTAFTRLVEEALTEIPKRFRDEMKNVAVVVEEDLDLAVALEPGDRVDRQAGHRSAPTAAIAGTVVLVASALAAGASFAVWYLLDRALGRDLAAQLVSVGGALAASVGAYLVSCRLLGVRELQALLSLRARLRRA